MCGWVGIWRPGSNAEWLDAEATRMANAVLHRGPDDGSTWCHRAAGVAFGFRRLAIVDLSEHGRQPMRSQSGRYTIVFNGEVYNFAELRPELLKTGHTFLGHSDTEVMLAAVDRFVGMFAFALWDDREHTLTLARDRFGVKPLYYGFVGGAFLCGSELKALRAFSAFAAEVDRVALTLFMRHNYIPDPYSIYRGISKLGPGTLMTVREPVATSWQHRVYWSAVEAAERGRARHAKFTAVEAADQLEAQIRESVRIRMVADVPLGAFLSGGIDSSTVVALMQAQSSRPIKTFTIGFREEGFDEALPARAVARHLGTEHTELYVTGDQALAVVPRLAEIYDEPFSDPSQIPTFLVSELARRHVTVCLSGDGGDEVFGGYPRYLVADAAWRWFRAVPAPVRRALGMSLTAVADPTYERWAGWLSLLETRFGSVQPIGSKMHRLGALLMQDSRELLYRSLVSHAQEPSALVVGGHETLTALTDPGRWASGASFLEQMMLLDTVSYLPEDIFTKVDRASMAVSLEARVPLVDHRLFELAWTIPASMKIRGGCGKWILRRILDKYVPRKLVDRPKMGFGVPVGAWLRGPLREWASALLAEDRLRCEGFLNAALVGRMWQDHQTRRRNWQYHLWDVLMFQTWLERWGRATPRCAVVSSPPSSSTTPAFS